MTWPGRYVYVCAIEGLGYLLTDSDDTGAVTTAWSGTDWAAAKSGLFVDLTQKQSADPWEPFQPGGTLMLTIADEEIGVLTHRTAGGAETELDASIDQSETTIPVKDTSSFPDIGIVYIGTESVFYGSKTSTSFNDCIRGLYCPFGTGAGGARYAHNHRVGVTGPFSPPIQPKVTQYPRTWIGRWVGLWVHGYNADGSLQTKAEAQLVFAGRLVEVRDDADLLSTVFVAEHVLTDLREATLGRDMFEGEVADGIYIPASGTGGTVKFYWKDETAGVWREADPLVVVASGAAGTNQMNEGFYTHDQLFTVLNAWLAGERAASRLWGSYTFALATSPDGLRTKVYWGIGGTANSTVRFKGTMHKTIAIFLGFDGSETADALGTVSIGDSEAANDIHHFYKNWVPLRSWVSNGLSNAALRIENGSGAFQDQLSTMPASAGIPTGATGAWGLFLFDNQILIRAQVTDNGDGTYELHNIDTVLEEQTGLFDQPPLATYAKRLDDNTPTKIRQVFLFEMRMDTFLNMVAYSGGTPGYNHATYDALPYGCGLAYPGELFGAAWETSVANMPGADKKIAPIIDKPVKLSALIGSDLVLRHVFPIWKTGGLRMQAWQTPTVSLAIAALTEDNKAEPSGRNVNHRSTTLLSDRWAKNLIKIEYNRDSPSGSSEYNGTINIEDRTAIDDIGDRGSPFTIEARNTLTQLSETGAGIEDLVPNTFIPILRLFTKAMRTLRRSVDRTQWDLAPGDIVTVTDKFARDPTTGIRLVSDRPGIVISHSYNPGGAQPSAGNAEGGGNVAPVVAEVDLMFIEANRVYAYAPSALVASYDPGTLTLTCAAHEYSEASEDADATWHPVGGSVRIIELDPDDPANPLTWTRNIVSKNGNDIVHDGVALAGFDPTKEYQIIPDTYSAVAASQQDKAFQADDADGLVEDEAQAFQFGVNTSTISATSGDHTDLPERHSELLYGDGKPYDVGSIIGCARMVENLIDHKTAIQSPFLSNTVLTNTTYSSGSGYRIVWMAPIYLSAGLLSNSVVRYLRVAPWFRSSDGTSTKVRVSLCKTRPEGDTLDDGYRGEVFSEAEWTTSSTSWQIPTRALLTCNVKNATGVAWIVIECNYKAETRGLAECTEQERMEF